MVDSQATDTYTDQVSKRTLTEIARRAGLSRSHVSRVLSGKREPSLGAASRIAKAAGITLGVLERRIRAGCRSYRSTV